jgi:hypothetical protein
MKQLTYLTTTPAQRGIIDAAVLDFIAGRRPLLTESNAKIAKGLATGWLTTGIHLAPHTLAGGKSLCPASSPECRKVCLTFSGHGEFPAVQLSRIAKTRYWLQHRDAFMLRLDKELRQHTRRAERHNLLPAARLCLTSDNSWEREIVPGTGKCIMELHPTVQFYDYTKIAARMSAFLSGQLPPNYHLTFSRSEKEANHMACRAFLRSGGNVAAVFAGPALPAAWDGFPVVDGDADDLTFLRPPGTVFGLLPKGRAAKAAQPGGFIIG